MTPGVPGAPEPRMYPCSGYFIFIFIILLRLFYSISGSSLVLYPIRAYKLYKIGSTVVHYMFMVLYPLGNMALYGSIYITLAVSIERFLGKCHFFLISADWGIKLLFHC